MMSSIKSISFYLILSLIALGCLDNGISEKDYDERCPYERKYGGLAFYLETPLFIHPHKKIYNVGDTITVSLDMSDLILDLSREKVFQFKNFSFFPNYHLYLVDEEGWHTGLARTDLILDTLYDPRILQTTGSIAGSLAGTSVYENGRYHYSFSYVLKEPGRYISLVTDKTNSVDPVTEFNNGVPEVYAKIENDSGCPEPWYSVCYVLEGDPHYEDFSEELKFVDEEVYKERFTSLERKDEHIWGGTQSGLTVEWHAIMGFEVVD